MKNFKRNNEGEVEYENYENNKSNSERDHVDSDHDLDCDERKDINRKHKNQKTSRQIKKIKRTVKK